jgi:hypothetical protein
MENHFRPDRSWFQPRRLARTTAGNAKSFPFPELKGAPIFQ